MSEAKSRNDKMPKAVAVKQEEPKKYPPALSRVLLMLLAENNGDEKKTVMLEKALRSGLLGLSGEEEKSLNTLSEIIRTGNFDENDLLDMAISADASLNGGIFRKSVAVLAQQKTQELLKQGNQADAVSYISDLAGTASDQVPELQQLCNKVLNEASLGLLGANKRNKLAEQWEEAFRANPRNWGILHGLAVLYWWKAVQEEKILLQQGEKQTKSGAQPVNQSNGYSSSPWNKAIGFWMYLLGPCQRDFQAWFLNERQAQCGFSANKEQLDSAWSAIREQINGTIHQFKDEHDKNKHAGRAAFMQMLTAQMQVEDRFVNLWRDEIMPYVQERNDVALKKAAEEVPTAGPSVLIYLNKSGKLANVLNLIESKPPPKGKAEDEKMDQFSEMLASILFEGKDGQKVNKTEILDLLKPAGSRMTRKYEGAVSRCEELAIFSTPLGPLFFMAQNGSLDEVLSLMTALPAQWQASYLAKHILATTYRRAAKMGAGRGLEGLNETIGQWNNALEIWNQPLQKGKTQNSIDLMVFLERRLPGMISHERNGLIKNIPDVVKSACENRINTANKQQDPTLLIEPIQYMDEVYAMLLKFKLTSDDFTAFFADTVYTRGVLYYKKGSDDSQSAQKQIDLLKKSRKDLLKAGDVFPAGLTKYQDEAAIISANVAGLLFQQGDLDSSEEEMKYAIKLSSDEKWKNERKKQLAIILASQSVKLFNDTGNFERSMELLEKAAKLDPNSQDIQNSITKLKNIQNSRRTANSNNSDIINEIIKDPDQAIAVLQRMIRDDPTNPELHMYMDILKKMKHNRY